eukprot:UN06735
MGNRIGDGDFYIFNKLFKIGLTIIRQKPLWMLITFGFFMFGTGGGVYCVIRNSNWYNYDHQTGTRTYFVQGGQTIYGGAIIASLHLLSGVALISMVYLSKYLKSRFLRDIMGSICLLLFFMLIMVTHKLYKGITPHYRGGLLF